jgi:chemotaxis response regulator CheB
MSVLRILIADDHEVARRGVRCLLEGHPGWEVCGDVADGREAVAQATRLKPDIVLPISRCRASMVWMRHGKFSPRRLTRAF